MRRSGSDDRPVASGVAAWLRRIALACAFAIALHAADAAAATFVNAIVAAVEPARPILRSSSTEATTTRAIGDGAIGIARARRLQDIGAAPLLSSFRAPPETPYSKQAPELQRIRGRWVIHFAASDGDNARYDDRAVSMRMQR